jgi:hypothetical protein
MLVTMLLAIRSVSRQATEDSVVGLRVDVREQILALQARPE